MTHPLEQLAPYVDGSLTGPERAGGRTPPALRAPRCRRRWPPASEARAALRSMPEVEVPTDLGVPALEAMATGEAPASGSTALGSGHALRGRRRRRGAPGDHPASAGRLDPTTPARSGRRRLATAPDARDLRLEVVATDFDADSLQAEAQASAARYADAACRSRRKAPPSTVPGRRDEDGGRRALQPRPSDACEPPSQASRATPCASLQASFEGTPAYLAFVLEGPGPGSRPTR